MPTRQYKRIWCKTCKEFTLHNVTIFNDNGNPLKCRDCDTEYSDVLLRDIPQGKIKEQRKRYKESQSVLNIKATRSFLRGGYGMGGMNPLEDMFNETWPEAEIQESDAGQRAIDERARKERESAQEIRRAQHKKDLERADQYAALGRNDICICGKIGDSGKPLKYKKCCLSEIREIENTRRIW